MAIRNALKNVWNAFLGRDPTPPSYDMGSFSFYSPLRPRLRGGSEKDTVKVMYNRIAVDCAAINVNHVRLDEDGDFKEIINDSLNYALTKSANIDQTGRALLQDAVTMMLDEGHVAIVPVEADIDPDSSESFKVYELRAGKVIEWGPRHVLVDLYNDKTGMHSQLRFPKSYVAIIQNPFYLTMNDGNSTVRRLLKLYRQVESMNDMASSGKLDLIIQLPYSVKTDIKREQAESRRKSIEAQLTQNQYGIAYVDATERIIQLNRSLENNLWVQIQDLQNQLYAELGFSQAVFDGTADEKTMLNYNSRTIEPIMTALTEEMERKWISKTAITQGQAIMFFKDPFKLVPVAQLAEISDKFTRNEIMSSNEFRSKIGLKPSDDPRADQLINSNLNHPDDQVGGGTGDNLANQEKHEKANVESIIQKLSK